MQQPLFRIKFKKMSPLDFDGEYVFESGDTGIRFDLEKSMEEWFIPEIGGLLFLTKWNMVLRTISLELEEFFGKTYLTCLFSVATLERVNPKLHKPEIVHYADEQPTLARALQDAITEKKKKKKEINPYADKAKCVSKKVFGSMKEAEACGVYYQSMSPDKNFRAYKCAVCHRIHLTTKGGGNSEPIDLPSEEHVFTPFEVLGKILSIDHETGNPD